MDPPVSSSAPPMDPPVSSRAPTKPSSPPPMDPPVPNRKRRHSPVLGSLKNPFVYVPADGNTVGRFVPSGSGAQYCFPNQPPPPPGCEKKHIPGPSVPAAQAVQQDISFSNLMPGITICRESPITAAYFTPPQQPSWFPQQPPWLCPSQPVLPHSHQQRPLGRRLTPSLGSPFLRRVQFQWGIDFYIRIDHAGYYHTYPHVGGLYKSLQEAERAIERYLHGRRDPKMFKMDNVSSVDIAVRQCLYYPDGARRRPLRSEPVDEVRDSKLQLVHALVDKYNEDNNLSGDLAYEINAVGCYQTFCEGDVRTWYHHINFTAKTKGAVYSDVFFAEVIFMLGDSEELPVSCLCVVKPTDIGNCFGCMNHGNFDMKHPNDVGYVGGHVLNTYMPFNGPKLCFDDEDLEAEEARLRSSLQCLDNPQPSFKPPGSPKKYPGPPGLLGSEIPGLYC